MLINSLLSSSEVWYGVENNHIEKLEKCDRILLTRLFSVPFSCSYEAVFLETGCLPIRFIIQGRRLMYYWTLLNKSSNELVKKFFEVQKQFASNNDWILQITEDKKALDIDLSEQSIQSMKKHKFKKYIKEKLHAKATQFLFKNKSKHSKSNNLNSFSLQDYVSTEKLNTREKKLLFSLRTRSIHVKTNYKTMYKFNMKCFLCENDEDSEKHLLKCPKILENIDNPTEVQNACYENIYSQNLDDQIIVTKIYDKIFKTRNILLKQK